MCSSSTFLLEMCSILNSKLKDRVNINKTRLTDICKVIFLYDFAVERPVRMRRINHAWAGQKNAP